MTIKPFPTFWTALRQPPACRLLCRLRRIHDHPDSHRSPILLIHGFPDSERMFDTYVTPDERKRDWLRGRNIYAIALPNRRTNPSWPSLADLRRGRLAREVAALIDAVIAASPTGKVVIIAHDWGATLTWALVRRRPDVPIEKMVALSVGSSFRYDWAEHGLRALAWLYSVLFGLPYYLPPARHLTAAMLMLGGYRAPDAANAACDSFHYWDWPLTLMRLPLRLIGYGRQPPFTDIRFPVLFMRCPLDRIASTAGFELALQQRPDCQVHLTANPHWFPEQRPEEVLRLIRPFLAG
ncbi:alpha/beta fold hydrolase [Chloroflexus sp.]|uniref:alpha/beta fold hydrolase n=1 Tax=Chloroflexus sp. TaxID=1904827 RepID=UPI00260FD48A|nr:alpha/beta hydrolase [uncultured Chloroflexus sp.]